VLHDDLVMSDVLQKLTWSLPWLARYPFWRLSELTRRFNGPTGPKHLIVTVANHFEPAWSEKGFLDLETQKRRLDEWCELARKTGELVRDHDNRPFLHTNFYPAEQYHQPLLHRLSELQAEGFGEVEVHLHHGLNGPDTVEGLRKALETFRDTLAEEHQCLSRFESSTEPKYAFVHGNLALANSAGGRFCGVDSEMQILAETGCYADLTLPSAPQQSQVPRINAIYECGHPFEEPVPHRSGPDLRRSHRPKLPVIMTGPLIFNWSRRLHHLPVPRLDDGALTANYLLDVDRFNRWASANICVRGRPDWVFIKLYCHGFFSNDQDVVIGEAVRQFWWDVFEDVERTGKFKIHFTTAREAFNIAMAAVDGHEGDPGLFRDYKLKLIMGGRQPRVIESDEALLQQIAH
jgi:hypothetical protein